jgi:hypothetical protein
MLILPTKPSPPPHGATIIRFTNHRLHQQQDAINIIQQTLETIANFVLRIYPHAFDVYIIDDNNGTLSILRYDIFAIDDYYMITSNKTRTYDNGFSICSDVFNNFREQLALRNDIIVTQENEDLRIPSSSLRPSSNYEYDILPSFHMIITKIKSNYWEDKKHGYAALIQFLKNTKGDVEEEDCVSIIAKDLVFLNDDEITLMAIIALQLLKETTTTTAVIQQLLDKTKTITTTTTKIPFDHGDISLQTAQDIVSSDMPGRFLIFSNKIITYHAYSTINGKSFRYFDFSPNDLDNSISYNDKTFPDIWHLVASLPSLDRPIFPNTFLKPLLQKQADVGTKPGP